MANEELVRHPRFKKDGQTIDELFGLEPEMSLQSVNFATAGNPYLTDHAKSED
jgi:hypothetical protein